MAVIRTLDSGRTSNHPDRKRCKLGRVDSAVSSPSQATAHSTRVPSFEPVILLILFLSDTSVRLSVVTLNEVTVTEP